MISEEEQKDLDRMMAAAKIDMARYKRGLYGGMAFNIVTAYEFMTIVNTCKNLGMDRVYWLDGDKVSVELTLTEALKICATLMKSFGRSLAGEHTLMNIHLDAYKEHKKPGATAENLKANVVSAATPEQIATAKLAAHTPADG